jgi:glycosyl hydrolase family 36
VGGIAVKAGASRYGDWAVEANSPTFVYSADHSRDPAAVWDTRSQGTTRRHWAGVGNRRIQMFADNEGTVSLFDEHSGVRWLAAPEPVGTGLSWVEVDGKTWGSLFEARPEGQTPRRTFGPTWFRVEAGADGVQLERTILCPEGEAPWVLVRVALTASRPVSVRHREEWAIRPSFLNLDVAIDVTPEQHADVKAIAERAISYDLEVGERRLRALERAEVPPTRRGLPIVFDERPTLVLEALGETDGRPVSDGARHPTLALVSDLDLAAGETRILWFRFGIDDGTECPNPSAVFTSSLEQLAARLPRASSARAPMAEREVPWHAALLTGQACVDGVLGGHALDQGSAYTFALGFNGAARDPLQHALPLIYSEPDLALSVLRNTCSWGAPDGKIPWSVDGSKQPRAMGHYQAASDLGLWALWFAAEYAAATGDLAAFDAPVAYHPTHAAPPASLFTHLKGHFRYLLEGVAFGPNGHLRVLDCDWADGHLGEIARQGIDRPTVRAIGESVLNSAMAAWVLPVWAGLCDRLGDRAVAEEARAVGERLRQAVAGEWNGRWFNRARVGELAIGADSLFLEVQPWAILSGAATADQARTVLAEIDAQLRRASPLGARQRWPLPEADQRSGPVGECLTGGIWPSLQMTLIWAAAKIDPELAWDEWRRFSLANHTATYPEIWEGTITGPDTYNAPEAREPGRTWALPVFSMQQFPVNNLHVHAQPILAYLRLLGVEPLRDGALKVAGGDGSFRSRTFELDEDGSGSLLALGEVIVRREGARGVQGAGRLAW